jgi:TonB-dependent starch-binding outer membrane protein SusC
MNSRTGLIRGLVSALMLALFVWAPSVAAAQEGAVEGTVTDARTGQVIGSAQVSIVGTQRGTLSGSQGQYRIPNVTPGEVEVRATFIGYRTATQTVTVGTGETVTLNFQLAQSAVALDEILVTGTAGRQDRRAQAASVSSIDAASITDRAPVTSVSNLLQARTSGVSISASSGTSGATQRIRLRGSASIELSNEPIVIIDGIRMDSRQNQLFGVGGQQQSRLNDINPEDIESIEIVKGPAAATLYGADASAGVIQIRTKRGAAGSAFTQTVSYEFGHIDQSWSPPANYGVCTVALTQAAQGLCAGQSPGSIISDNPIVRENVFQNGEAHSFSWSGRGGGENFGYFLSLNADEEQGTLPNNEYNRYTARMNFDFTPRDDLRVDASVGMGRTDNLMPQNDNNIYGYIGGSMLGSPVSVGRTANDGWFAANRQVPAISSIENSNMTIRATPSIAFNYTPTSWFTHRLQVGADITRSEAFEFWPKNENGWYGTATLNSGVISQRRQNRDEITLDYLGTVQRSIGDNWLADIAFGGQAVASRSDLSGSEGQGLTTNAARSVDAAAATTGEQQYTEAREGGILAQLDLGYQDRLYFQFGGRLDRNSAFGDEVSTFFNPKVGISYVLSEEEFYPVGLESAVSTLRLRGVWGSTGRSPGSGASLTTFSSAPYAITAANVGSGVLPNNPGNAELSPERGVEWELGFDAGLFDERVGLEVTYYNKTSQDLILERPLPPSLGFANDPLVNIGELQNRGWEIGINSRLIETAALSWDARLNFSTNVNEVTDLGDVEPFGTNQQVRPGFPAFGWWTHKVLDFDVANNQAIVSDTMQYAGNPNPGWEGNFSSTFTLPGGLSLYGQMDWAGDFTIYNNSDQFRERQFGTGERWVRRFEALTPEERLRRYGDESANAFLTESGDRVGAAQVNDAYYEDGTYLRLRELSLSYTMGPEVAGLFRAERATVTLGARNLALWSDYLGPDPEMISAASASFGRTDFLTVPQSRRLIARVNLTF